MIKKSVFENDIIVGMQRELTANAKNEGINNLVKAADYLQAAMEIFEEAGLITQADQVLSVLSKVAVSTTDELSDLNDAHHKPSAPKINDPHIKGLTSDKMIANLKHHGTVFNMSDDGQDILDKDVSSVDDNNLEVFENDNLSGMDFEDEL